MQPELLKICAARSSVLSTFIKSMFMEGRPVCWSTFVIKLLLPNRRGEISTKWFSQSSNCLTCSSSSIRSVKNSPCTIVPNLKGFIISNLYHAIIFNAKILACKYTANSSYLQTILQKSHFFSRKVNVPRNRTQIFGLLFCLSVYEEFSCYRRWYLRSIAWLYCLLFGIYCSIAENSE